MPPKDFPLADKRCVSCNAILFVGNIQVGIIDIDCRKCKTKNVIIAGDIHAESRGKHIRTTNGSRVRL